MSRIRTTKQAQDARQIAKRQIVRTHLMQTPTLGPPDAEAAWARFWPRARNFTINPYNSEEMAKEMYMWGWQRKGSE